MEVSQIASHLARCQSNSKTKEYHRLAIVVVLGFVVRFFAGKNSLCEGGILLYGFDEYYHMRRILYSIDQFPNVLWFDSYLNYPSGLKLSWPPLFDLISAALSLSLGQHHQPGAEIVVSFIPIFLGSITITIVYFLVREIFNRNIALLSAFLTAIAPYFVQKTKLGAVDHHCLEILFFLSIFYFLVLAFSEKNKFHIYSIASGIMIAGLTYTWLGSALYLSVIVVYILCQTTLDLKQKIYPKDTPFTPLIAFLASLILMIPYRNEAWMQPSFVAIVIYILIIVFVWTACYLAIFKKFHRIVSLLGVLILIGTLISSFNIVRDNLYHNISNLLNWSVYIFGGGMAGKISEAQPLFLTSELLFADGLISILGWGLIFSLAGFWAFISFYNSAEQRKKKGLLLLFIGSFSFFIFTLAQIRFLYIYDIFMSILISNLFFNLLSMAKRFTGRKGGNMPLSFSILLLLIMILPNSAELVAMANNAPPIAGDWYYSLNWLKANTNTTSYYNDPCYVPEYGVMCWWDYGNWVVHVGQRPVVSNNFQAGAIKSAKFFLSNGESDAAAMMSTSGSKYVITDSDMMYSKLAAIAIWAGEDPASYRKVAKYGSHLIAEPTERLLNSTMTRLHFEDASGISHFRLIYESPNTGKDEFNTKKVKIFEYVPGAIIRADIEPQEQVGVVLNMTSNQGRTFQYSNTFVDVNGGYEIRVPYSTDNKYGTHAIGLYSIFAINNNTKQVRTVEVSEDDIVNGRMIHVNF